MTAKSLAYLVILLCCLLSADCKTCKKVAGDVCTCQLENGTRISLDALSGDRSPVFSNVQESGSGPGDGSGFRYFYDPCRSFRLAGAGLACDGVSVCQEDAQGAYYNLGELGRTAFGWDAERDLFYISYTGCLGETCRVTNVSLICEWDRLDPKLEVFPQYPPGSLVYNMSLTSRCACPAGCPEERHPSGGLSSSGIFLLVLLTGALTYLVVGVAFRRTVVGATGAEMIPNRAFWAALPGLVRDGVTYCITCRRPDNGYDQI